ADSFVADKDAKSAPDRHGRDEVDDHGDAAGTQGFAREAERVIPGEVRIQRVEAEHDVEVVVHGGFGGERHGRVRLTRCPARGDAAQPADRLDADDFVAGVGQGEGEIAGAGGEVENPRRPAEAPLVLRDDLDDLGV